MIIYIYDMNQIFVVNTGVFICKLLIIIIRNILYQFLFKNIEINVKYLMTLIIS